MPKGCEWRNICPNRAVGSVSIRGDKPIYFCADHQGWAARLLAMAEAELAVTRAEAREDR